jgi:hypothetical protein
MLLTQERRDDYLALTDTQTPPEVLERLAALGVTTLQELRDYWAYDNRQHLVAYLGDSPLRFVTTAPPAGATRTSAAAGPGGSLNLLAAGKPPPLVKHPRGVLLTAKQRQRKAETPPPLPPGPAAPVRQGASLVSAFPAVRDQGQRGTCVAFASIAYLEYHLAGGVAKTRRLSEQFLYWACKESDGVPDVEGTHVRVGADVVRTQGACLSRTWRYSSLPGATEGQGPPPEGAEREALNHRWPDADMLAAGDIRRLRQSLEDNKPVVLSVYTFPNWDFPVVAETGEVTMPLPGADEDGAHAVCLAGYELNNRAPGGGAFIFRNSWGRSWGKRRGRFGPGYGVLPFEYVKQYAIEAFH